MILPKVGEDISDVTRGSGKLASDKDLLMQVDPTAYYYQKFKETGNRYLNDNLWSEAAKHGETGELVSLLSQYETTDKPSIVEGKESKGIDTSYYDRLKTDYKSFMSYDDEMLALSIPFYDDKTPKPRTDEETGYSYGNYTDKQWAEMVMSETMARYDAEILEEHKANRNWFQKVSENIFAGGTSAGLRVVAGVGNFAQDIYNIGQGLLNIMCNWSNDDNVNDRFLWAFSNDENDPIASGSAALGETAYKLDHDFTGFVDARDAYKAGYRRDQFGEIDQSGMQVYNTWGKWWSSGFESLGYMIPSMILTQGLGAATKGAEWVGKVGTGVFYTGIASGNIKDTVERAKLEGISYKDLNSGEVMSNALIKSVAQWGVEVLLGKIIGFSGLDELIGVGSEEAVAITRIGKTEGAAAAYAIGRGLKDAAKEGLEEVLQDLSDKMIDTFYSIGSKGHSIDTKEANLYAISANDITPQTLWDSFVVGALTSAVTGAVRNAKYLLPGQREIDIDNGRPYRLGAFQTMNLIEAYKSINEWNDILNDKNSTAEQIRDASLKMSITMNTVGSVIKSLGQERAIKANIMLNTFINEQAKSEAVKQMSEKNYAQELFKAYEDNFKTRHDGNKIVNKAIEWLKNKVSDALNKKGNEVTQELQDNNVTEVTDIVSTEKPELNKLSSENTDTLEKIKKLTDMMGVKLVVGVNGNVVTVSDDIAFIDTNLLNSGKLDKILTTDAFKRIVKKVKTTLTQSQRKMVQKLYNNCTNQPVEKETLDDAIATLLFDANFYTKVLLLTNERKYKNESLMIFATIDKIVNHEGIKEFKAGNLRRDVMNTMFKKVYNTMKAGLITFATTYNRLNLDNISDTIIPTTVKDAIKNHHNILYSERVDMIRDGIMLSASDEDIEIISTSDLFKDVKFDKDLRKNDRELLFRWYDMEIDILAPEFPNPEYANTLKQYARSNDINHRAEAAAVLQKKHLYHTSDKAMYVPNTNTNISNEIAIEKLEEVLGIDSKDFLKGDYNPNDLSDIIKNKVINSNYDLSRVNDRLTIVKETLETVSNNTLTIFETADNDGNYNIVEIFQADEIIKDEYLWKEDKRYRADNILYKFDSIVKYALSQSALIDNEPIKIGTLSDFLKVETSKEFGDIGVYAKNSKNNMTDLGYYDTNNNIIVISNQFNSINTLCHEVTHAAQAISIVKSGSEQANVYEQGFDVDTTKNWALDLRASLNKYISETFKIYTDIENNRRGTNDFRGFENTFYWFTKGEMTARCGISTTLLNFGFTFEKEKDGTYLRSPDKKRRWRIVGSIDATLIAKTYNESINNVLLKEIETKPYLSNLNYDLQETIYLELSSAKDTYTISKLPSLCAIGKDTGIYNSSKNLKKMEDYNPYTKDLVKIMNGLMANEVWQYLPRYISENIIRYKQTSDGEMVLTYARAVFRDLFSLLSNDTSTGNMIALKLFRNLEENELLESIKLEWLRKRPEINELRADLQNKLAEEYEEKEKQRDARKNMNNWVKEVIKKYGDTKPGLIAPDDIATMTNSLEEARTELNLNGQNILDFNDEIQEVIMNNLTPQMLNNRDGKISITLTKYDIPGLQTSLRETLTNILPDLITLGATRQEISNWVSGGENAELKLSFDYEIPKTSNSEELVVDNEGNRLTESQAKFFEKSKVRDENGNLRVMYHTTGPDFDTFDMSRSGQNYKGLSEYGEGAYFSYSEEANKLWAKDTKTNRTIKAYLNITNPVYITKPASGKLKDYILKNYDNKTYAEAKAKNPLIRVTEAEWKENINRLKDIYVKNPDTFLGRELYDGQGNYIKDGIKKLLQSLGYDGIIDKDQVVVFEPNQIKKVTNQSPTMSSNMSKSANVDLLNSNTDIDINTDITLNDKQLLDFTTGIQDFLIQSIVDGDFKEEDGQVTIKFTKYSIPGLLDDFDYKTIIPDLITLGATRQEINKFAKGGDDAELTLTFTYENNRPTLAKSTGIGKLLKNKEQSKNIRYLTKAEAQKAIKEGKSVTTTKEGRQYIVEKPKKVNKRTTSNKEALDSASILARRIVTGKQIEIHPKLKAFEKAITSKEIYDSLPIVLREKLEDSSLTYRDILNFIKTSKNTRPTVFKLIADKVFDNKELAKLDNTKMNKLIDITTELSALSRVNPYLFKGTDIDLDATKVMSYDDIIDLRKRVVNILNNLPKDNKLLKAYTSSSEVSSNYVDDMGNKREVKDDASMRKVMPYLFFKYYDGTLRSLNKINNAAKQIVYERSKSEVSLDAQQGSNSKGEEGRSIADTLSENDLSAAAVKSSNTWKEEAFNADVEYDYYEESNMGADLTREEKLDTIKQNYLNNLQDKMLKLKEEGKPIPSRAQIAQAIENQYAKFDAATDEQIDKKYAEISGKEAMATEDTLTFEQFMKGEDLPKSSIPTKKNLKVTTNNSAKTVAKNLLSRGKVKANKYFELLPDSIKKYYNYDNDYKLDKKQLANDLLNMPYKDIESLKNDFIEANKILKKTFAEEASSAARTESAEARLEKLGKKVIDLQEEVAKQKEKNRRLRAEKQTLKEKIAAKTTPVVIEVNGEKQSINGKINKTDLAQELLETAWNDKRMSKVQGFEDEEEFIANYNTFVDTNRDRLNNADLSETEETVRWFTDVSFTADDDFVRKFYAIRQYYLAWVLSQTGNGGMYSAMNPNLKQKVEHTLRKNAVLGGMLLSNEKKVKKILERRSDKSASIEIGGVNLPVELTDKIYAALETDNIDQIAKVVEEVLAYISDHTPKKANLFRKLVSLRSMAMLSSPVTWLRNKVSNMILKPLNKVSSKIGNSIWKGKSKATQLKFTKQITPEIQNYIVKNFVDTGIFDKFVSKISKYNPSDINKTSRRLKTNATDNRTKEDILAELVFKSMYNEFYNQNTFKNKFVNEMHKKLMKVMSDDSYVREAAIRYFGKILAEKGYDLSSGKVNDSIMNDFAIALGQAMNDYMHSDNLFNKFENYLADTSDLGWFAYKTLLPFASASWNWFKAAINLSPLGLARSIYRLATLEKQVNKAQIAWDEGRGQLAPELTEYNIRRNLGQGVIGTIAWGLGAMLACLGFIRLDEDDYGTPKLHIGNLTIDVSSIFGSTSVLAGAALVNGIKDERSFLKGLNAMADVTIDNLPLMEIVKLDMYSSGGFDMASDYLQNVALSYIPNIVSWVAGGTYGGTVKKDTFWKRAAAKIPFLANVVEKNVDPYTGESGSWIEALNRIIPYFSLEIASQNERTTTSYGINKTQLRGQYTINDKTFKVTGSDLTNINKLYGQANAKDLTAFYDNQMKVEVKVGNSYKNLTYSQMDSEQIKKAIQTIMSNNAELAKIAAWTTNGNKYYGTAETRKKLIDLGYNTNVYVGSKGYVEK